MHATLTDAIADTAQNAIEAGARRIEVSLVEDGSTISLLVDTNSGKMAEIELDLNISGGNSGEGGKDEVVDKEDGKYDEDYNEKEDINKPEGDNNDGKYEKNTYEFVYVGDAVAGGNTGVVFPEIGGNIGGGMYPGIDYVVMVIYYPTEEELISLLGEIEFDRNAFYTRGDTFYYNVATEEIAYEDPHNYVLTEHKDAENCGINGYDYYVCENCGGFYYDYFNKFEHSYVVDEENTVLPTDCGTNGKIVYVCTDCGEIVVNNVYREHNYVEVYTLHEGAESCEDGDTYGLSVDEIDYISAVYDENVNKKSAVVRSIGMPDDAIAEKINEAFADNFGDVVLELSEDGEYRVIEDYFEEIGEWLRKITK